MSKIFIILIISLNLMASCLPKNQGASPGALELSPQASSSFYYLQFQELKDEKKYAQAEAALKQALELDPSPFLYLELANFYWQNLKFSEARTTLKQGIEKFPQSRDLYLSLAKSYLAEKRFDHAATTLEEYLKLSPEDYPIYQELAAIYVQNKKYAQALDLLKKVPSPRRTKIMYYYLGRASSGLGLKNKAVQFLKKAVQIDPKFIEAWAELAFVYELNKDYVEAEKTYAQLLQMGEESPELLLRLIDLNLKLNNPDKAMLLVDKGPKHEQFKLEAVNKFISNKFYSYAQKVLAEIMSRKDFPARTYFYLAILAYEKDQDAQKAVDFLNKIPEDNKFFHQALLFRIQLLMQLNKLEQAMSLTRMGQKKFPRQNQFWLLQANIYENKNKFTQAMKTLDKALKKWPNEPELLFRRGVILDKMGKRDQAIATMEKIIASHPDHDQALNYVGYTLAEMGKDLERALVLIQNALKIDPDNGYYLDSLAWVYFKQHKIKKAWQEINRAIQFAQDNPDPTIWEHYGDIAKALNKPDLALRGYKKALELKPSNREAIKKKIDELSASREQDARDNNQGDRKSN
ncbi:tetratricopeptide repeat protein [Desulfohalobiaceae bacterium Ax17]|jgi:tetratricopeptide (TPR) repeat protein|uniref:tetratricopeptide repeat protein n=1 Tax=Desulfovulcanus ferrireducens TaxID=2831190 RepID=UPI00207BB859|nr:tetratricopeptide repeat protein [Desulfovulcanus ferrireducens]MBT8763451.1 tetratricopeptide repeat protein [Desulfovulcanus ferrireducens]